MHAIFMLGQARVAGRLRNFFNLSVRPLVGPLQNYEQDCLKKRIHRFWCQLAQEHDQRGKGTKQSCFGVRTSEGQRSRSHEAEDTFRGLAEVPFSTSLGQAA